MQRPGEETLIRYFLGKSDPAEEMAVKAWLALQVDEEYTEACLREAFYLRSDTGMEDSDMQSRQRVWAGVVAQRQPAVRTMQVMRRMRYAAAVIVLVLAGSAVLLLNKKPAISNASPSWKHISGDMGISKTIALPDSSSVILFPGASVEVPSDFNTTARNLRLHGRAFLQIARNKAKPFRVTTGDLTTQVLGTSFEIDADSVESIITLHTGCISVDKIGQQTALLHPNEQLRYDRRSRVFHIMPVNAAGTIGWIHGEFSYTRQPIRNIIHDMEKWYGISIHVSSPDILDRKVIFSYRQQPLTKVILLLSKVADLQAVIKGKDITLSESN